MSDPNAQQCVAVPVSLWHATIELLTQELPMKKTEGLVNALRQCQPIDVTDAPTLKVEGDATD